MFSQLADFYHGTVIMFPCGYEDCDYTSSSRDRTKEHQEGFHEGAVTRCPICDAGLKYESNLHQHIKAMHGTQSFPCDQCSWEARTQVLLNRHKRDKHREKLFKCEFCDHRAATPSLLSRHHHHYKFECDKCGGKFQYKSKLSKHFCYKYSCNKCHFKTNQFEDFEDHKKSLNCKEYYTCNICSIRTSSKNSLTRHLREQHSTKPSRTNKFRYKTEDKIPKNFEKMEIKTPGGLKCGACVNTKSETKFSPRVVSNRQTKAYEYEAYGGNKDKDRCAVCHITICDVEDGEYFHDTIKEKVNVNAWKDFLFGKLYVKEKVKKEGEEEIYLCPVGSCKFSLHAGDPHTSQQKHFQQVHANIDFSLLRFLKL